MFSPCSLCKQCLCLEEPTGQGKPGAKFLNSLSLFLFKYTPCNGNLFEFSKTKLAAFDSSPDQMKNREPKGSMLFFAFHGHTEHNFSSVPWKSLAGIRAIRGKYNCALGQNRAWARADGGEGIWWWVDPGCSLLRLPFPCLWTCQGSWHIPAPGWHLPELDYAGSRWHGSTWLVTTHSTPKTSLS